MKGKLKLNKWAVGLIVVVILAIILYQPLVNYLTKQAANPDGFIGSTITRIWSVYFRDLSEWGLTQIDIDEYETILDVGFGGGANIKNTKEKNIDCTVYGVDISEEAVKTATELNQRSINDGSVILALGDVAALQFKDAFFNLVIASQTHIHWDDLNTGLSECYRVLKTGGTFLITCEIDKIEYHLQEYKDTREFSALLSEIGFSEVMIYSSNNYVAFICKK